MLSIGVVIIALSVPIVPFGAHQILAPQPITGIDAPAEARVDEEFSISVYIEVGPTGSQLPATLPHLLNMEPPEGIDAQPAMVTLEQATPESWTALVTVQEPGTWVQRPLPDQSNPDVIIPAHYGEIAIWVRDPGPPWLGSLMMAIIVLAALGALMTVRKKRPTAAGAPGPEKPPPVPPTRGGLAEDSAKRSP